MVNIYKKRIWSSSFTALVRVTWNILIVLAISSRKAAYVLHKFNWAYACGQGVKEKEMFSS